MPYIGKQPEHGRFAKVDQINSGFNGSAVTFNLTVDTVAVYPTNPQNLLVSIGGVIQQPGTDYTVSAATLTLTSAPAASTDFFGVLLGDVLDIGTPSDGSVTVSKMAANSVDSDQYVDGSIDLVHMSDDAVGADELAANAVVNASVASGAAIEFSKMENLTASRLLVSDGSGDVSVSTVTTTNLTDLTDSGATTLHSHAGGGPSAASEAEMVTASSTTVYASPGRVVYNPHVLKAGGRSNDSGVLQTGSVGFDSITRYSGTIYYKWYMDPDFDNTNYFGMASNTSGNPTNRDKWCCGPSSLATGNCNVETWDDSAGAYADAEMCLLLWGTLE